MSTASLSATERARFAVKPASWPKLLVPCALGQAIGTTEAPRFAVAAAAVGLAYTVLDLLFVVLLNDYFDQGVDALKRSMFPETSPKTIPDGVLPARTLLVVGAAGGAGALAAAVLGEIVLRRPGLGLAGALGLAIFVAYSLPPLRLNYRGGGELLEALGIGVLLPWFNAYAQGGAATAPALGVLPAVACFSLASALASGLSDEESDRRGGKRTFTTMLGNVAVRRGVDVALVVGALSLVGASVVWPQRIPPWVTLPPAALVLGSLGALRTAGRAAVTNAFPAQSVYKGLLHRACWRATTVLAVLLLVASLVR